MKWRIWLLFLVTALIGVFMFGFASTEVYYKSAVDDSKRYLRVYMNAYDDSYTPDREGALAFSKELDGARVTFMDVHGNVLADSETEEIEKEHSDREEIKAAILNGEGYAVRSSSTLGKNMVYYCKNIEGRILVRIAVFTDSDWSIFVKALPAFAAFSGVLIVLCVILAFVTAHVVITPVKRLAFEAAGNKTVKAKYTELEPVAEILNERNRNIKRQMDQIQAEKELVERARESKDEFISNVTHEMNTPLTSIHGYAELLNMGGLNAEQCDTAYKTILAQSERLTNLIACIINYNEIDSDDLPPYEVDFSALSREILQALKPEADNKNVTFIDRIEDNVTLLSRHELLNEVFGNLVRNAVRYNKEGGSVTVTLNRSCLTVEDTGVGIAEENLDKVFSRFFTVDKSHGGKNGGFGLGLAVVKKICVKSGWKISVESKLGEGSKFTVKF